MSASSLEDWISYLQETWRRQKGSKWFLLILAVSISGVGFTIGLRGLKNQYISWTLPGLFLGITGIFLAIYSVSEIFCKNIRTIRLRRRRQARNWTSPPRSSLCEYHNAGLYISTPDDLPSDSHDFCQMGRCLHTAEDIPLSTGMAEEYLEMETGERATAEDCTYYDNELRSVESDSQV